MSFFNNGLQNAIAASSSILGSILFFGIIGYLLFNKYDNIFWLIGFLIIGSCFGLYDLYKQIKK